MRRNDAVAVECVITLLGRESDSVERAARIALGAELIVRGILGIEGIAKMLASIGK